MSPCKFVLLALAAGFVFVAAATAQVANPDFKINKITPAFQDSPSGGAGYDKRVTRARKWLEVEVSFDWQPRLKDPLFLDELTFTYYILLANENFTKDRQPTLLVGSVTHVSIPQEKDLHSVAYVSPRSLERFFGGTVPGSINSVITDIGVTISQQGQVVAESVLKGRGAWWTQRKQTTGFVLDKGETPFSSLAWDYFEAIKPKSSGQ